MNYVRLFGYSMGKERQHENLTTEMERGGVLGNAASAHESGPNPGVVSI